MRSADRLARGECQRLLEEVQARELDPLSAVREILEKVYGISDSRTLPR